MCKVNNRWFAIFTKTVSCFAWKSQKSLLLLFEACWNTQKIYDLAKWSYRAKYLIIHNLLRCRYVVINKWRPFQFSFASHHSYSGNAKLRRLHCQMCTITTKFCFFLWFKYTINWQSLPTPIITRLTTYINYKSKFCSSNILTWLRVTNSASIPTMSPLVRNPSCNCSGVNVNGLCVTLGAVRFNLSDVSTVESNW